jgi:ribosomal protein L37AE/L43A
MSRWDTLHRIDGLFVGLLDKEELEIFDEACRLHHAHRLYEGAAGLMGLAKVSLSKPQASTDICEKCGKPAVADAMDEILCASCADNAAEAAWERHSNNYEFTPLIEQQRQALKLK